MKKQQKKRHTVFIWSLLCATFFLLFVLDGWNEPAENVGFETFIEDVEQGRISSILVHDNQIHVKCNDGSADYVTLGVVDDELTGRLSQRGAHVAWGKPSRPWVTVLTIALPLLLLVAFLWYFVKKASAANTGMFALGKSCARLVKDAGVTFADVGGCEAAKEQLGDVVDFLQNPTRWTAAGARLPRGVLLEGPPGCGKTLLARAVAGETKASFYCVAASEFVELFVGVGAARVRDMFQIAAKHAPAVVFVDELDAVGRRRGSGIGPGHDEREQTLNQLLVSLDGFEKDDSLVVIAATNRSDILDPALLRPGRFDRRIEVPVLSGVARREVLRIHTRNKPLAADISLEDLTRQTDGFTGAELENLANEAALLAARRARRSGGAAVEITRDDFRQAFPAKTPTAALDHVDTALIESVAYLTRPRAAALARIEMQDRSEIMGNIIWADATFIKIFIAAEDREVVIPKNRIVSISTMNAEVSGAGPNLTAQVFSSPVPELA